MTTSSAFAIMQLFHFLLLLVGTVVESHYLWQQAIPLPTFQYINTAALVPTHYYPVSHPGVGVVTGGGGGIGGGSRETLEENSGEGVQKEFIPDISDEQAHLDPDDSQIPSKPSFPAVPRPVYTPPPPVAIPKSPVPSGDSGILFNGPHPDGSYDFSYDGDGQTRKEQGDSQGNVQGTYSYIGPDGKEVTITYTAGAGKGYVPEGEGLLPPPTPRVGDHDDGSGDDGQNQLPFPSDQRPVQPDQDDSQHQVPESNDGGGNHKGMPYNYNYEADTSGKKEIADDSGHVEGSYWYIDGSGDNRTVTYTANHDEGFIAKEHISTGPGVISTRPPVKGGSGTIRPGGDIAPVPHPPVVRPPLPHPPVPQPPVVPPLVPHPPTKGVPPPAKGVPPPTKGVPPAVPCKGAPRGRCPNVGVKGGSAGGSGWDKYPLGTSVIQH